MFWATMDHRWSDSPPPSPPSLYQVVPFSQRSGVLEWCSGTVPIGDFLTDPHGPTDGAHGRCRPQDWTNMACRKRMMVSADLLAHCLLGLRSGGGGEGGRSLRRRNPGAFG